MKESEYDTLLGIMEEAPTKTVNGYYPTVNALKAKDVERNTEKFLPILTFFASDPYKREGNELISNDASYQETVRYCRKVLYGYVPESDEPE